MTISTESDRFGPKIVLVHPLTIEDIDQVNRSGIARLQIRGFGERPVPNLSSLRGVEELVITAHNVTSDVAAREMTWLKTLELETYARDPIDFRVFGRLERLHLNWRPGAETAFQNTSIRSLSVSGYPFDDLGALSGLTRLQDLRIANSRKLTSLAGVQDLPELRRLWLIDDSNLSSLDALSAGRPALLDLRLNTCRRVRDLRPLGRQVALERLAIIDGGPIESLGPVAELSALTEFWLYGTTRIQDGDISPLLRLPRLARTSFADRRHYSHRTDDVERELQRRHPDSQEPASPRHWW